MEHQPLTSLLIDARLEYTKRLVDILAPYVLNYMEACFVASQGILKDFQMKLREIPTWNALTIESRTREIANHVRYLNDVIAAVIVSYVKVMSSIRLQQDSFPNIKLKLPSNEVFVHQVYVNTACALYNDPHMYRRIRSEPHAKLLIVHDAVEKTVRDNMPMEEILKCYLGTAVDEQAQSIDPGLGAFPQYQEEFDEQGFAVQPGMQQQDVFMQHAQMQQPEAQLMQPQMQPLIQPQMQPLMQPQMQPQMQPLIQPQIQPQPLVHPQMQPLMQPQQPQMQPQIQPQMQPQPQMLPPQDQVVVQALPVQQLQQQAPYPVPPHVQQQPVQQLQQPVYQQQLLFPDAESDEEFQ